jgi:hypothetical protein
MRVVPAAIVTLCGLVLTVGGSADEQGRVVPAVLTILEGNWGALIGPVFMLIGGWSLYRKLR